MNLKIKNCLIIEKVQKKINTEKKMKNEGMSNKNIFNN